MQLGEACLLPVESGAPFGQEQIEELAGGAAISLAEGMGEVHVVVQVGDGGCEVSLGNSFELVEPVDLCGDMGHRLANAAWRTEGFATFLDADGPHITGPDVHVLKKLAVDRSQIRQIVGALTHKFGGLTKLDDTCLNKIVLRVAKRFRCLGAGPVPQNARAGDEVALPVLFKIAGLPGVRHSRLGYCTWYRRRTRSRSSAAVMVPRA